MTVMMRGPSLLRERMAAYLSTAVPSLIVTARTQWGLTALQLPDPIRYDAADPYIAEDYPIMGMYLVSDRDHIHRDFDDAAEREYWSRYTCRAFVGVRTPKDSSGEYTTTLPYEETIRLRDNMRTILVNAMLQSPSMGGLDVEILEETITTDYDEPYRPNDKIMNVYLASAVVNVDIRMQESLYLPTIGTANTLNVQVVSVPRGDQL